MKIINGTVYSKGNPTLNFGYYNPLTKNPYSDILSAKQYLNSKFNNIPQGFTICVILDDSLVEYWFVGNDFIIKNSGVSIEDVLREINNIPEITIPNYELQTTYLKVPSSYIPDTPTSNPVGTFPPSGRISTNGGTPQNVNWLSSLPEHTNGYRRYFSTRTYCDNIPSNSSEWTSPIEIVNRDSIIENIPVTDIYPFTIYAVSEVPPPTLKTPNFTLNNDNTIFGLNNVSGINSDGITWYLNCPSIQDGIIWVSNNTFKVTTGAPVEETGWTTPRKFVDIDGILEKVLNDSNEYIQNLLESIRLDLDNTLEISTEDLNKLNQLIELIDNNLLPGANAEQEINELKGLINLYAYALVDGIKVNKEWYTSDFSTVSPIALNRILTNNLFELFSDGQSTYYFIQTGKTYTYNGIKYRLKKFENSLTLTNTNNQQEIAIKYVLWEYDEENNSFIAESNPYDKIIKFNNLYFLFTYNNINSDNIEIKKANYAQNLIDGITGEITNKVESSDGNSLNAAIQNIASNKILSDVWSYFEGGKEGLTSGCINKTTITQTPELLVLRAFTGDSTAEGDDSDIRSSVVDLIAGKLTLSATNGNSVVLSLDGATLSADLSARTFTITGDVIAKAIEAKELNINNKTYINQNGSMLLAAGTNGQSFFDVDGKGYLAGGAISWGQGYAIIYKDSAKTQVASIVKNGDKIQVEQNETTVEGIIKINTSPVSIKVTIDSTDYDFSYSTNKFIIGGTLYYTYYAGYALNVSGIITAFGGNIGNWTIGSDAIYNVISLVNNNETTYKSLVLSPNSIYSISLSYNLNGYGLNPIFNWRLNSDGSATFAGGHVVFNSDGSGFIGVSDSDLNNTMSWGYENNSLVLKLPQAQINQAVIDYVNALEISVEDITLKDNNDAVYGGFTSNSDSDIKLWLGGGRNTSAPFYVTKEGEIHGSKGTLNVINNNHISDYRGFTSLDDCPGFRKERDNYYVLVPSELGNVVYLPDIYPLSNSDHIIIELPCLGYVTSTDFYKNNLLEETEIYEAIGRNIIIIPPIGHVFGFVGEGLYEEQYSNGNSYTDSMLFDDSNITLPNSLTLISVEYTFPNSNTPIILLYIGLGYKNAHPYVYSRIFSGRNSSS